MDPNCWYIIGPLSSWKGRLGLYRGISSWDDLGDDYTGTNGQYVLMEESNGNRFHIWEKWVRPATEEEVERLYWAKREELDDARDPG